MDFEEDEQKLEKIKKRKVSLENDLDARACVNWSVVTDYILNHPVGPLFDS
jgi:hypothetical protein